MADLLAIALFVVIVWSAVQILNKAGYSGDVPSEPMSDSVA